MVEPAATSSTAEGVVVATKLHVPRPRSGSVPRPLLVERLEEATVRELTLVCAPAGFGKTTVLGEWVRSSHRPVAWLSLDAGDSDPVRFWRYVAAALDTVHAGLREKVAAVMRGGQQRPVGAVVSSVINELAAREGDVVLVLDDFHLLEGAAVHDCIGALLEQLPWQLRLVVVSRSDPPLPLARLRGRRQLTELREADLRFTLDEATALLVGEARLDLSVDRIAALRTRTEGWVVGLQLAALSLAGRNDPDGFVDAFTGSHRFVLDYLTEEVLARQDDGVLRFLLETSVLDRLSGPLCDAVTGRDDSQAMLEAIERANLFLVPLDEHRRWWRYHHLFGDLLRARARQADPDRVPLLHRAAAAWHDRHGVADDAIRHALAADEIAWAVRLIETHVEDQIGRRSEGVTLARWLASLPDHVLRARPRLCVAQAIGALVGGRADEAERLVAAAEQRVVDAADEPYVPSVGRASSILTNLPAVIAVARADVARLRGRPLRAADFARQASAHLTADDWLLGSLVRYHLAVADWMRGALGEAEHALTEVVNERFGAGEQYMALRACYDLGQVLQARGALGAATDAYKQALHTVAEPGRALPPFAGMVKVGLAEVAYERNDLNAAAEQATAAVALCRDVKYVPPLAAGLAILARVRHALGDVDGAMEAIEDARHRTRDARMVALLDPVPAVTARLRLAGGDVIAPAIWMRQRGMAVDDEPIYPRESDYLILARLLLADDTPKPALALLERLHALAVAHGRARSRTEIALLQARGLTATGDDAGAVTALAEALDLAAPERYVRVFLDEGPALADPFRQLLAGQRVDQTRVARAHLYRVVDAFAEQGLDLVPPTRHGAVMVPGLMVHLTPRELEVLQLLAAGKSNRMIAHDLVVTLDTVKKHVSHVLDKLQAGNRTEAVARARTLDLIT